ncbi:type II secretion system F family protein [Oleiharenicola lentus]|uniref:type II secretion system F family protein n=1 Tax=Oleiharenicola lentus TaxID=2508720 RepID=UPI003F668231
MARFNYTARTAASATPSNGTLDAANRRAALQALRVRGLHVLKLDEEGAAANPSASKSGPASTNLKFTSKERLPFLESLADLIGAGMSAGESVRLLAMRLQEPKLRGLCAALWTRLGEGSNLSHAMADHPDVFDRQTVNLIAAGEATGNLSEVLTRLITHFNEQKKLRNEFIAAMAYPAFICVLGFAVVIFLLFFLMPRIQALLNSLGGKLPFATQVLVSGSRFLLFYGPLIVGVIIVATILLTRWRKTTEGRRATDGWLLRIPIVKEFVVRYAVLNFSHTLAVLLENGVTTAEALRLTERAINNTIVQEQLHEATDRVMEGSSLSASLMRTGLVAPLFLDRLSVGEQTGNLVPSLRQTATSYQAELSRRLSYVTKLFSGIALFTTFSFVAFLAYAIVSAIFEVTNSIRL